MIPLWTPLFTCVPFTLYRWRFTRPVWFYFAARSYGEIERRVGRIPGAIEEKKR